MNPCVLVIPDVHGRAFWKDVVNTFPKEKHPDMDIVFLGDYLDPYTSFEGITEQQAFDNFNEILVYAHEDTRVTLLIGNHDWHYFVNIDRCRMDMLRKQEIAQLFIDNLAMFRMCKTIMIDETTFVFSHAGFTMPFIKLIEGSATHILKDNDEMLNDKDREWLRQLTTISDTYDWEVFEKCLQKYDDKLYNYIPSVTSYLRGGWGNWGSFIWADANEHCYIESVVPGIMQVFGHTLSFMRGIDDYVIRPDAMNWAMLDSRQAFVIDADGEILPMKNL